jgi:hypothetical protein
MAQLVGLAMRVPWHELEYKELSQEERDSLRWNCPHLDSGPLTPEAALLHIPEAHDDCWSCAIETVILREMLQGRVWFWESHSATAHHDDQT